MVGEFLVFPTKQLNNTSIICVWIACWIHSYYFIIISNHGKCVHENVKITNGKSKEYFEIVEIKRKIKNLLHFLYRKWYHLVRVVRFGLLQGFFIVDHAHIASVEIGDWLWKIKMVCIRTQFSHSLPLAVALSPVGALAGDSTSF